MDEMQKEGLRRKLSANNKLRVLITFCAYILAVFLAVVNHTLNPTRFLHFTSLALFVLCYGAAIAVLIKKGRVSRPLDYLITVFDYAAITCLIHLSGGIESPFYLIYMITIMIEALDLFDIRHVIFNFCGSCLSYAGLIIFTNIDNLTLEIAGPLITRLIFIIVSGWVGVMYFRSIARQKDLVVQTQRERVESLKELANALAHEIRNPLTGIKCLALAVKEKEDNPKKLEFLTGILEETGRLESFTYNFLNFAQPFKLNLKGFDLVELIDEVMSFPGLVSGKEISFVKELPQDSVRVFADRDKIRQVFQNIISNAIDAIEDRGEIRVVLKLPWPDTASITISDTGRGISSANLTNIFRPFFTLKDRGSGLGLSIAKKVIELHGGKIKVQSAVGQGTTFTIHLPLAAKKDLKLDAMTQARSELRLESMG